MCRKHVLKYQSRIPRQGQKSTVMRTLLAKLSRTQLKFKYYDHPDSLFIPNHLFTVHFHFSKLLIDGNRTNVSGLKIIINENESVQHISTLTELQGEP